LARADRWIREVAAQNVLDSAAVVLALAGAPDEQARVQRRRALDLIETSQASNGGWGLYATSAPEPFDTAVVMLALSTLEQNDNRQQSIDGARKFLLARQLSDGSWPETTRPAGQESYAQRISTAGWATLALLSSGSEFGSPNRVAPQVPAIALAPRPPETAR
jgi:hypothetical protein